MDELIRYILQWGHLSKPQITIVAGNTQELLLKKGAYFSKAGQVPHQVGFVVSGVMRGFYYNSDGEEITRCFITEDNLVADYMHFEAMTPAGEYLQACTDCSLIVFTRSGWNDLSRIDGWDHIKARMVYDCMYKKSRRGPVISQDATTRYLEFLENYPSLINHIPLAYIASYLGVTQQSLSRIRKNILL